MQRKERFQAFVDHFSSSFPEAETELHYSNPYELLVAVVLSAQCTDKRINQVTPALFKRFPSPKELAESSVDEIFSYIRSVSYPNNKAKHLLGLGQKLIDSFHGEVPESLDDLQTLPGVGRKTANVIASVIYNQPAMAVDTHVYRVSRRLGLVPQTATTPLKVEQILVKNLPNEVIARAHHWLILHGRYICLARKPMCSSCQICHFCAYFEKNEPKA
ncbi:endonuclease III [Cytophagaceae bacterium 50C-KIRBA]|uniref:Endonuclease III n=1 Tax=Aquirufa beregesia TaxID=2516556 RepID=A0ABX0EW72_9BACT|nr:endonuclease III [Aquirufa beregesia]NGZ44829.1 endonuclease III [Aquirufa beregesia]